ncbi:MAG: zinc ribbon domain-containing protein [Thaumarchaeota archaeon]|nr:zinc ribbon domain-containing protein [Nitrososphaerota archaeon]
MFCVKCGAQLPDEAQYCFKCGTKQGAGAPAAAPVSREPILAPSGVTSLKCPSCGAPLAPKFGEMIITCEYCGNGVSLATDGWKNIQRHTMLPLRFQTPDQIAQNITSLMDKGLLHRHLHEDSTQEELTLALTPYWVVPASARTNIVASDTAATAGTLATTAVLAGVLGASMGGGRMGGGFGGGALGGMVLGTMWGGGMGRGGYNKAATLDNNYNYPVVALKALTLYQPHEYEFTLDERVLFDVSKVPKGVKVLNGDVSEEVAKYQTKTFVDQLQTQRAHQQYHMIQQISTEVDVGDAELLHAPIWFARFDHKGKKIVLVLDGNSGRPVNSVGL